MRIRAYCVLALLAFGAAALLSQGAAVPISQEHHHHLILSNSYVQVYEVEVPPHESTLLHQHDYDYVYVVFGDADITNAVEGRPAVNSHLVDGTVNFVKGPLSHVARNNGDTPFRNITISLLHKQGDVETIYPSLKAGFDDTSYFDSWNDPRTIRGVTLFHTSETSVYGMQIPSGETWTPEGDDAKLIVKLGKTFDGPGPKEKNAPSFPANLLRWVPPGAKNFSITAGTKKILLLVLEFND